MKERIMSISFLVVVTTIALGSSGNVLAAGSCKAMDKEACTASTAQLAWRQARHSRFTCFFGKRLVGLSGRHC